MSPVVCRFLDAGMEEVTVTVHLIWGIKCTVTVTLANCQVAF